MLQDVNQMEWDTCQSNVIFLYLHPQLPSLSLCVYLGSCCSRISSVLPWPLPLPSSLPTQVAFLPVASQTGLYQWQRQREREKEKEREEGMEREGKDSRRQDGLEKVFYSVWIELLQDLNLLATLEAYSFFKEQTFRNSQKVFTTNPIIRLSE